MVTYKGRQVPKEHFRVYVYDKDGNKKLADSYDEYLNLTSTGLWFDDKATINISKAVSVKRKR